MAATTTSPIHIAQMTTPTDLSQAFDCLIACFGHQTHDGVFSAMNPTWDTPTGRTAGAQRLIERWHSTTKDKHGRDNTIFLKAVSSQDSEERVIGLAIWVQASFVDGHGDAPIEDLSKAMDLETLYPGNEAEQRFLKQCDAALHKRRIEVTREKKEASASPPSIFALDICVVHPWFQRRGIAGQLVQWGIDEAGRRGGLECTTEASVMGRAVYKRLGFNQEGGEIEWTVDEEFRGRSFPSNIFMRTGA